MQSAGFESTAILIAAFLSFGAAYLILRILAVHVQHFREAHTLKTRVHELRLALKHDVASRLYAEEKHREAMLRISSRAEKSDKLM